MDSRERVFTALNFEQPDRVPIDFWASTGFYEMLRRTTGADKDAFLDQHDVDFRYIAGPRYVGPPLDGDQDIWGVRRRSVTVATQHGRETYREVATSPLADATTTDEIDAYEGWPSPDWFDYTPIRAQCEEVRNKGRIVVFMGDRLNRIAQLKPAMYLRGVEQILVDMVTDTEIAHAVFRRFRRFYTDYLTRILEAAGGWIDIVLTGDDFGSQNGPLVSPAMWETFLAEGFGQYVKIIADSGARSMHHTCGQVTPIVPAMVERGLNVLQSLQPEAMGQDFARLKREFGGRLAFHGGMSIQQTLPHGTPEDVRNDVRERVRVLAPGGGYILGTAHNVQADCAIENVEALLRAYRELGRYGD